jgi:hypothetical protein
MAAVVVAIPKPGMGKGKMKGRDMGKKPEFEMDLEDDMPIDYEDEGMEEEDDLDGLDDMEEEEDDLSPVSYDEDEPGDMEIEMATAVIDSLKSKDPASVARSLKDFFMNCCGGEMES